MIKPTPQLLHLPKIEDERGNLSFLENENQIPFKIKRVYWVYDVPGGEIRGSHAKKIPEIIIALSGSFDVFLSDGKQEFVFHLNRSYYGLFIPALTWRTVNNFSTNALALVVSEASYDANHYIRDYDQFLNQSNA